MDVTKGKLVVSQPGREPVLITADLNPADADRSATVLDELAAGVIGVVDVPVDEEGKTFGQGGLEGHELPCELDAVGAGATHRQRRVPGPLGRDRDVVGAEAQGRRRFAGLDKASSHPRAERAGRRLVTIDDGHELEVAAAERHDAIAGAVAGVTPTRDGRKAMLLVEAPGRRVEVCNDDDHVVEGQHP